MSTTIRSTILFTVALTLFISALAIYITDKYKEAKSKQFLSRDELFQIQANPFNININVLITQDTAKALAYVKEHTDSSITIEDFRDADAVTFTGQGEPTMWFPLLSKSPEGIAIANHELLHVLYYVTNRAGLVLTKDTEEVFAYALDYLTIQFYNNKK